MTIYVSSSRLLCAKNGEFQKMREGGGSAVAYGWYIWKKGLSGRDNREVVQLEPQKHLMDMHKQYHLGGMET